MATKAAEKRTFASARVSAAALRRALQQVFPAAEPQQQGRYDLTLRN